MTESIEWVFLFALFLYIGALLYIMLFCLMQFQLLYAYRKYYKLQKNFGEWCFSDRAADLPNVTVQLPIFNEYYVAERLINAICELKYPMDKLEIQVLDDSTDETYDLVASRVAFFRRQGYDIKHIHRMIRSGFKAGALRDGMKSARGELIAIFDADFLPKPEFLLHTIPYFADDQIGVVQTRWEHINEEYSIITKLQAFQLNVHFRVEQTGRYASDLMLQFNGTAGVWRKKTIEDAGGWEADTLTEDLDLSYRAQLRGWKIKYLEGVGSPAELPAEMNAFKSQQYRWMKGGAETARKILPSIWRSGLPLSKKIHATGHLLSSAIFLFVFMAGVMSVPALLAVNTIGFTKVLLQVFLISLFSIGAVYFVANFKPEFRSADKKAHPILKFTLLFPIFLALSMGLSLHNSIAVIQGYLGKKTAFIRTPKFNITSKGQRLFIDKYLPSKLPLSTVGEGLLSLYFFLAVGYGIYSGETVFILYHLLLALGFGTICYFSIRHLSMR